MNLKILSLKLLTLTTEVSTDKMESTDIESTRTDAQRHTNIDSMFTHMLNAFEKDMISEDLAKQEEEDSKKVANDQPHDDPTLRAKMLKEWESEFLKSPYDRDTQSN